MNDLTRCPRCGKRVTAFAAGCDECGATLDVSRFRRARASSAGAQARSAGAGAKAVTQNAADTVRGWVRRATSR
jgi:predicted amidophosphoribosyltransferase